MSCFGELYAQFPKQMWDLCMEQCLLEQRPYYEFDWDELDHPCAMCGERQAIYEFSHYSDHNGLYVQPLPWPQYRAATCAEPLCIRIFAFYAKGEESKRRAADFRRQFRANPWDYEQPMRIDACLAHMLKTEANERIKENSRRAA